MSRLRRKQQEFCLLTRCMVVRGQGRKEASKQGKREGKKRKEKKKKKKKKAEKKRKTYVSHLNFWKDCTWSSHFFFLWVLPGSWYLGLLNNLMPLASPYASPSRSSFFTRYSSRASSQSHSHCANSLFNPSKVKRIQTTCKAPSAAQTVTESEWWQKMSSLAQKLKPCHVCLGPTNKQAKRK